MKRLVHEQWMVFHDIESCCCLGFDPGRPGVLSFGIWRFIFCAVSLVYNFKSFYTEVWTVAIREFCCATGTIEVQFIIFVAKKVKQTLLGWYKSHLS